jgi:ATP-dependent Clp protease ATP-binding subunit ClpC
MTSNIGSNLIQQDRSLGFTKSTSEDKAADYERMKGDVLEEIKRFFKPEFLNRIDGSIVFHALSKEHVTQIVDLQLDDVNGVLSKERGISLEVTDKAKTWLAKKGYDPLFGARPIRRLIQESIEDKLSDSILAGDLSPGDTAVVDIDDEDQVTVESRSPLPAATV